MSKDKQDKSIDDMINALSDDLTPVKRLGGMMRRFLPVILLCAAYAAAFVYIVLRLRLDMTDKLFEPLFIAELSVFFGVFLSALFAALRLSVPDVLHMKLIVGVPLALSLVALALLFMGGLGGGHWYHIHFEKMEFHHCMMDGMYLLLLPAAAVIYAVRKGATTHPFLCGLMSALSVGAIGWIGLRLGCESDEINHLFFAHFLPFFGVVLLVCLLARKIFRW